MPIFKIRVPSIYYDIYYINSPDVDLGVRDFKAGVAQFKFGEPEWDEFDNGAEGWEIEAVTSECELKEVRSLPLSDRIV